MSELRNAVDSVRRTASTVASYVVEGVTTLLVGGGLAGWSVFWSNLARLHYSQGDLASAVFTMATFVAPVIGVLVWYVGESLGIGVVPLDIDTVTTSS